MQITKIKSGDAKELSVLDAECFSVPWSEQSFLEESKNPLSTYFVARENDKIIGYAGVWIVQDEGQITNIAVLPDFRKKGVASGLLAEILKATADCAQIVLEVRKSNIPAISLYEKYGFCIAGERKNFYHSPIEDAIIMIRSKK